MKSRYDVLQSASDRRNLATFRASSAVGIVMAILVIGAVVTARPAPENAWRVNLLAAEVDGGASENRTEPAVAARSAPIADASDDAFKSPSPYVQTTVY